MGCTRPGGSLTHDGTTPELLVWPAVVVIALGAGVYFWCLSLFATVGRGTPGPWDAPRRVVVVGPYRWVRNPIYVAALLVVVGEAWLFLSLPVLLYAAALALGVHLFVATKSRPCVVGSATSTPRTNVGSGAGSRAPRDGTRPSARSLSRADEPDLALRSASSSRRAGRAFRASLRTPFGPDSSW